MAGEGIDYESLAHYLIVKGVREELEQRWLAMVYVYPHKKAKFTAPENNYTLKVGQRFWRLVRADVNGGIHE